MVVLCCCAALIKVCLAFEQRTIPGNLHFKAPNPNNTSLTNGVLKARLCALNTLLRESGIFAKHQSNATDSAPAVLTYPGTLPLALSP